MTIWPSSKLTQLTQLWSISWAIIYFWSALKYSLMKWVTFVTRHDICWQNSSRSCLTVKVRLHLFGLNNTTPFHILTSEIWTGGSPVWTHCMSTDHKTYHTTFPVHRMSLKHCTSSMERIKCLLYVGVLVFLFNLFCQALLWLHFRRSSCRQHKTSVWWTSRIHTNLLWLKMQIIPATNNLIPSRLLQLVTMIEIHFL